MKGVDDRRLNYYLRTTIPNESPRNDTNLRKVGTASIRCAVYYLIPIA